MAFTKQSWLVAILAAALVASIVGNWYQRQVFQTWGQLVVFGDVGTAETYARLAMRMQEKLNEGDMDGVSKYIDTLIDLQVGHLKIRAEDEESPDRIRSHAAEVIASIEDGSLLDVYE